MNKISIMMKRHRQLNDIDQKDLASDIGIKPATLSRLENGHDASQDTMVKLITWLFSPPKKPDEPDLLQLSPPE
jgi:transcriptional regulator with XRE-family HTH domain